MRSAWDFASASSRSASAREWLSRESASVVAVATIESACSLASRSRFVPGVQDVLGVVELAGDRVLDVVDQFEHVAARHHAARRHRDAAGLFDDRTQFIERFKTRYTAPPPGVVVSDQCAWCYACDSGGESVCRKDT
jgi:hypothetical protein